MNASRTRPARTGAGAAVPVIGLALAAAAMAAVVGLAVQSSTLALVVLVLLALAAVTPAWRCMFRRVRADGSPMPRLPARYRWLPVAWVVLVFVHAQKFTAAGLNGTSVSRGGGPSPENFLQIGSYLFLSGILLMQWRRSLGPEGITVGSAALVAWPLWAVASTAWSLVAAYSLVRSLMLFGVLALAVFSARLLDELGDDGTMLARPTLRLFVNVCTLLVLFAVALPYTQPPDPTDPSTVSAAAGAASLIDPTQAARVTALSGRLAWYGVPPLVASEVWGVALLLVLVLGRRFLGWSTVGLGVRLALLAFGMWRTEGRTTIVAVVVALIAAIWLASRGRPVPRALGTIYATAVLVVGVGLFSRLLLHAATRGEGQSSVFNLNGRIPLWQIAFRQLSSVGDLFLGFGFGTSGNVLIKEVSFAGNAHNSWIDALIGTGIIGATLLTVWLLRLGWLLLRPPSPTAVALPRPLRAATGSLFVLLLVLGINSPELATPGFSWSLVGFLLVFALRNDPARVTERHPQGEGTLWRSWS